MQPDPAPAGVTPVDRFTWERVVRDLDLPPTTTLVALMLATFTTGQTGENARPGAVQLAAACGLKERAVRGHLTRLREEYRLIERTESGGVSGRRNFADVYRLVVPDDLTPLPRAFDLSTTTGTAMPVVVDEPRF